MGSYTRSAAIAAISLCAFSSPCSAFVLSPSPAATSTRSTQMTTTITMGSLSRSPPSARLGTSMLRDRRRLGLATGMSSSSSSSASESKETNINVKDVAEMLLAKFADIDVDSSGTLDEGEIYRVLSEMDYTREEAECIFKQIDKNGDGTISQAEFLGACQSSGVCAIDDEAEGMDGLIVQGGAGGDSDVDAQILKGLFAKMQVWVRSSPSSLCSGKVIEVSSEEEFDKCIRDAGSTPVCIMFAAGYCRKCMAMKPKFARIAQGYENNIVFLKVFIDKGGVPEIKKRANVVAVPTFQMWQDGDMVEKYVAGQSLGAVSSAIVKMADKYLDCGFSLASKIDGSVTSARAAQYNEGESDDDVDQETVPGKAEISADAMAAFRESQAEKRVKK